MHPGIVTAAATLVASSAAMLQLLSNVMRVARGPDPVTIVGETGSGKSTVARVIHEASGRPGRLAEISAGELNSELAPDELFGHGRGAFTGAVSRRSGLFAEAAGGTVLIDDFHWLRRSNQLRLLRVLDRHEYRQLGDDRPMPLRARIVIGSHQSLEELMRQGRLVPDLRWRLGLHELRVPSLAERIEDIAPLAVTFLRERQGEGDGTGPVRLHPHAIATLELAPWPGNVRQLRAVVRRAFTEAVEEDVILPQHLSLDTRASLRFEASAEWSTKQRLVRWALWRTGDQVSEAATLIGAHRNTVSAIRTRLRKQAVQVQSAISGM